MRESETAPVVIVAASNEEERIGTTLEALAGALPDASLLVADDASRDATQEIALSSGAWVIRRGRPHGKGANVTAAAEAAIGEYDEGTTVLLCDSDLGASASRLTALITAVEDGSCDLAVASFANPHGGGFGLTLGYARRAVERRAGARLRAPLSGQRAMRLSTLRGLLPLASGWGLETGMSIDAVRAGLRIREIELDLDHRSTGRTPAGFLHRAGQLRDIRRAARSR